MRRLQILIVVLAILGLIGLGTQKYWVSTQATDTSGWEEYQNTEYGFRISYPASWKLHASSKKDVRLEISAYTAVSVQVRDTATKLGIAVVCSDPTSHASQIASGQTITVTEQTPCVLPEDRDALGAGGTIETNIPLRDGSFLYVRGDYTEKPTNASAEIGKIISSIYLQ